jgi:hypothetical protein
LEERSVKLENEYKDIEDLTNKQSALIDEQANRQREINEQSTQIAVDELAHERDKIDAQTAKTTSGLYTNYQKNVNNYGVQAEQRARMGLGNSGYAESSRVKLYNDYQKNVTDTVNNANQLKADFDFKIAQARQSGNLAQAQSDLALLTQKMQLLTQEYDLRNNREQFLYQKERNAVADNQWNQQFDYNKSINDRNFNYQQSRDKVNDNQWQQNFDYQKQRANVADDQWQKSFDYQKQRNDVADQQYREKFDYQKSRDAVSDNQWQQAYDYQKARDAVSDSQWEKQYELSKKASARSYSSGGGSSSYTLVDTGDTGATGNSRSEKEIYSEIAKNIRPVQGVNSDGSPYTKVKDGLTGRIYNSVQELLVNGYNIDPSKVGL